MEEKYISLELNGFLMNAGILGFIKLLENQKAVKGVDYIINDFELLISKEYLLRIDLAQAYIDTVVSELYEQSHYPKLLTDIQKIYDETEKISDEITKEEVKTLTTLYKEVISNESPLKAASFKSAYVAIEEKEGIKMMELIDAVSNESDWKLKVEKLKVLESVLKIPYVKEILCMKGISYRVINRFWNNTAFLTKNTKVDMKTLFEKDVTDAFVSTISGNVKKSRTKICAECGSSHINENAIKLSVMEFMMDDIAKKPSAFWNFDTGVGCLCAKCAFTYLLVPLGFSRVKIESYGQEKAKIGMIFANASASIDSLMIANNLSCSKEDVSIQTFYSNLALSFVETQKLQANNIQVITRPLDEKSRYGFSVITRDSLELIRVSSKTLANLAKSYNVKLSSGDYLNVFSETLNNILNGRHHYPLIDLLIRESFRGEEAVQKSVMYNASKVFDVQLNKNQLLLENMKEGVRMTKEQLYFATKRAKEDGNALRIHLEHVVKKGTDSVIYSLLNALKTGNKHEFLNTLIRVHAAYKIQLSGDFVKSINDDKLFNDIAYAYLLGLRGVYDYKREEKGGDE